MSLINTLIFLLLSLTYLLKFFKSISMNLGKTIQQARKNKGLRQNHFAIRCGITPSYLSQIENNIKDPNLSTLKIISSNLGLPLPILFFLSLDDEDIQPQKKEAFQMISPAVKSLINEFFVTKN